MLQRRTCFILPILLLALAAAPAAVLADEDSRPDWQPRTNGQYAVRQSLTNTTDVELVDLGIGDTRPVGATAAWEGAADIAKDWVVWREDQSLERYTCDSRILATDLESRTPIVVAEGLRSPTAPRLSGDLVVWGSYTGRCASDGVPWDLGDYVLTVFDLNQMERVATLGPYSGFVSNPAIDGNGLLWTQHATLQRSSNGQLLYAEIGSEEAPAMIAVARNGLYDLSENSIVYVDQSNQLTVFDITTRETTIIDSGPIRQVSTDGDLVVWDVQTDFEAWELHGYTLEAGRHFDLASGSAPHQPNLGAGTLVWQSEAGRGLFGIRSASTSEFEQLHSSQHRNIVHEYLLWSGLAVEIVGLTVIVLRHARSG